MLKQVCIHKRCPFKRYALPAAVSPELKREIILGLGKEEEQRVAAVVVAGVAVAVNHLDLPGSVEQPLAPQTTPKRKHVGAMDDAADAKAEEVQGPNGSKRAHKKSAKAAETDNDSDPMVMNEGKEAPGSISGLEIHTYAKASSEHQALEHHNTTSTTANESGGKPASSIAVPAGEEDDDAYSHVTLPLPKIKLEANSAKDATDNNAARNDLLKCQTELQCARDENKRQGYEIKRQADEIKRLKSAVRALTASLTG